MKNKNIKQLNKILINSDNNITKLKNCQLIKIKPNRFYLCVVFDTKVEYHEQPNPGSLI